MPSKQQATEMEKAEGRRMPKSRKNPVDKPKRPKNAFMMFTIEQRAKLVGTTSERGGILKLLGQKWKDMSDAEKEPYVKMAADEKRRLGATNGATNREVDA